MDPHKVIVPGLLDSKAIHQNVEPTPINSRMVSLFDIYFEYKITPLQSYVVAIKPWCNSKRHSKRVVVIFSLIIMIPINKLISNQNIHVYISV